MEAAYRPAAGWPEREIEAACRRAEQWYRHVARFEQRVNLGSVVGFRHPAIVSEHDCVVHFARFLNEAGVGWEAMNHEVSVSRWLFDGAHPAATGLDLAAKKNRWRVDLAVMDAERFRTSRLPATEPGFQFDAFLEFAYLDDFWTLPGVHAFGEPGKRRLKVEADVAKIGRYLASQACRTGYVIVFEECDWGFPSTFAIDAELAHGCRVRFVRGYARTCPSCESEALVPIVWGMPGPELEQFESEGRVVVGGCLVHGGGLDPQWHCSTCQHRW